MSVTTAVATAATDINSYLPLATNAVLSVEQTLANAPSQTKLTTALGLIMNGAKIGEQVPVPGVAAISSLIDLVDNIVQGFNAAGLFSHKSASTPATAVPSAPIAPVVMAMSVPTSSAAPVAVSAPAAATAPVAASTTVATPASSPTIQQLEKQLAAQSAEITQLEAELNNQAPATPAPAVAHAVTPTATAPTDPRLASNPATTKLSGGGFGGFLRGIGHEAAHPVETLQTAEVAASTAKKS